MKQAHGSWGRLQVDPSIRGLYFSNLLTIALAMAERWDPWETMFIYWCQSIAIGYYTFKRIRRLQHFTTENVEIDGKPVQPTPQTRDQLAVIFAGLYGMFHLGYLIFILVQRENVRISFWQLVSIAVCVVSFVVSHRKSFLCHLDDDERSTFHIGDIYLGPFTRIVPMHLTIIAGGFLAQGSRLRLAFFLFLKTSMDIWGHVAAHGGGVKETPA